MIKERCVGADCESILPKTEEYYEKHGNYCTRCEWKASRNVIDRMWKQRMEQQLWNNPDDPDTLMLLLD